ncbi:polysaccharide deacetylase family protein [Thermopolyspora sp. NPDC052614]|uniref:polysaccharide deacetylase family protein n=1 Tax=Thermopolyspora sp. NPDC052614 TaxID=3155682 RepID=UPI00342BC3F0
MRLPIRVATCAALIAAVCAPTPAWSSAPAKTVDCAKVKCIALTFDDGPGQKAGKLLDALKKYKVKATFFLEGQYVKARPELAKRIAKEGHELGNHSYTHPDFTKMDESAIESEITRTQELVHKLTGKYPTTLRPPYGLANERVQAVATELGLPIVLWNTGSQDWATRDEKAIYKEVLKGARRDSVVLMHDWVTQTVDVMPALLKALKERGFHVVPVSALLRGKKLAPGEVWPKDATHAVETSPLVDG